MTGYQEAVCDLMAENGNLRAEIERLRRANEVQRECLKIAYDTLSDKNLRLINIRAVLDADKFFIDGQAREKENSSG